MPETDRPTPRERLATLPVAGRAVDARPLGPRHAGSPPGWVPALPPPVAPVTPPPAPAPASASVELGAGEPGVSPLGPALAGAVRAALAQRLPPAVRGGRWAPSRAAVAGLVLVVLAAVGLAVALVVHGQPSAERQTADGGDRYATRASTVPAVVATPRASTATLLVDVAGRVRTPGVRRLTAGSRVVDALKAAGGVLPGTDTSSLDLARPLVDGEQLRVGLAPAAVQGPAAVPGATAAAGPIDLNAATAEQLDALPGVGPVLAAKIVTWREAHGRFTRVEDLQEISGLGGKKYAALAPLVTVS